MPSTATDAPHPSIKAEALFQLGPIHFTNSMLMTIIVMAIILFIFIRGANKKDLIPGRWQSLVEAVIEGILGLVEGTAGKRVGRVIFPLIATLLIFILSANWLSLLPGVSSILIKDPEGELVPLLRAPGADLNTTLAMALIAVFVVQAAAIISHGVGGYLKELSTPPFLTPVHIVSELSRILSLACRLFGNIFGGEVLLAVMYFLFSGVFLGFLNFIFIGLELFFGLIQALLFSILTLNYIAAAVGSHSEDHGAQHAAGGAEHAHAEVPGATGQLA